jgi:hypothetical protein
MSSLQMVLGQAATVMLAAALAGVMVRRQYRHFYSFAMYLAVALAMSVLIILWPQRFYRSDVYQVHQAALAVVRFSMAIEVAIRTFQAFPGALATLRVLVFLIVSATALAVLLAPVARDQASFVGQLEPRVANGAVWLFGAIAVLILWYRLPMHPLRKAVLLSYLPYLLVFALVADILGARGWERGQPFQYARQIAYLMLVSFWAWTAWRAGPDSTAARDADVPGA